MGKRRKKQIQTFQKFKKLKIKNTGWPDLAGNCKKTIYTTISLQTTEQNNQLTQQNPDKT